MEKKKLKRFLLKRTLRDQTCNTCIFRIEETCFKTQEKIPYLNHTCETWQTSRTTLFSDPKTIDKLFS